MNRRTILIDAKDHLMGRLASTVAKALLQGQRVVVVRCELINISGSFYRNKLKFLEYLKKRCNVNPKRGPFHFRAPSMMFRKAVRGMVPRKKKRGDRALALLKTFEGIPPSYHKRKRLVVPSALRPVRLRPGRKYCQLGRLAHEVGWKYQDVVAALERKRKARAELWFARKTDQDRLKKLALKYELRRDKALLKKKTAKSAK
ncbi:hypothetical protein ACOME3_004895 [Neoechinorhynchus agilis]